MFYVILTIDQLFYNRFLTNCMGSGKKWNYSQKPKY